MIPLSMPFGPFLITDGGRLSFRAPNTEARFTFSWRKRSFAIVLQGGHLGCAVPVGRLPSTSGGVARRDAAMRLLRALGQHTPAGWHLRLLPDHRVQLHTQQDLTWPNTAAALITPIFGLVMQTAPVIDLLEEAGLA
jgi:hypothetical protein